MSLVSGTRLGSYEIVGALGAGGMGEVYRARDTRLNREVAIKVLPDQLASDPDRLMRFEREAQVLASLNDPNIAVIYGVEEVRTGDLTSRAIVMELLEGETLRDRLDHGALPLRKAIELGTQMADGLASAHEKGIVHRDLKPENLFVTPSGRIKILDFGLARQEPRAAGADAPTVLQGSAAGMVVGTAGYMSPEQVRGLPVDHRSDVFSFGCVLFEMVTGRRAFQRSTPPDTMAAILNEDPAPASAASTVLSPVLDSIIHHCLEKNPAERFQSMRDIAFALRTSSSASAAVAGAADAAERPAWRRGPFVAIGAALGMLAAGAAGFVIHAHLNPVSVPSFRKLTFQRGTLFSARFAADGHTIVYGAAWAGKGVQLFSTRVEGGDSRPFGIGADVLGVSSQGEMALSLGRRTLTSLLSTGRLGRAPISGGEPREVLDDVVDADWSRDGTKLAVTRETGAEAHLEYPIGHVLFKSAGYLSSPRIASNDSGVAFIAHPVKGDDRGTVDFVDLSGKLSTLTPDLPSITGLAWSPDDREIWYSAWHPGEGYSINAVTTAGRQRLVFRLGTRTKLFDQLGGRLLIGFDNTRAEISALLAGDAHERDVSWLDGSGVTDISPAGDLMLFSEGWEGGGPAYSSFLRKATSAYPVRLGDGWGADLSADGRWVLGSRPDPPARMTIVPVGAGESRTVSVPGVETIGGVQWFPDATRVLVWANEPGQAFRGWVMGANGEGRRAVTSADVIAPVFTNGYKALTTDGRAILLSNLEGRWSLYPVDGGAPRPLPALNKDDVVLGWSDTPQSIFVRRRGELPMRVVRVDLDTGRREPWRELIPGDPAGVIDVLGAVITPDGRYYAYSSLRALTELYLIEGVQ